MPECDLQLFDTSVSRYHAEFRRSDAGWFLVDLGSTNGTRINGWRINAPTAVHPGDEVAFGSVVFSLNGR
jgi:pSer/pThr/pTyr-binding forkhead associated (FHA) protein